MNKRNTSATERRLMELSFAKTEAELFLDTHPDCKRALDYYHRILEELMAARLAYRSEVGPIVAEDSSLERWDWVDSPWPWHSTETKEGGVR